MERLKSKLCSYAAGCFFLAFSFIFLVCSDGNYAISPGLARLFDLLHCILLTTLRRVTVGQIWDITIALPGVCREYRVFE